MSKNIANSLPQDDLISQIEWSETSEENQENTIWQVNEAKRILDVTEKTFGVWSEQHQIISQRYEQTRLKTIESLEDNRIDTSTELRLLEQQVWELFDVHLSQVKEKSENQRAQMKLIIENSSEKEKEKLFWGTSDDFDEVVRQMRKENEDFDKTFSQLEEEAKKYEKIIDLDKSQSEIHETVELTSSKKESESINKIPRNINTNQGEYKISEVSWKHTVSTPEWDTIELSQDQSKIVSKNNEAIVWAVKFNQALTEINCETLKLYCPKIIKMIQNHSGSAMEIQDGDYMKDSEIILFLSSIVSSIKDKLPGKKELIASLQTAKDLTTAKGLFMQINWELWSNEEVNQFGDSKIAGLFLDKFDFRWEVSQEWEFHKALNIA